MGVLRSSGRVALALLGLLLLLTPFTRLFLILVPLQPRGVIEYGPALVVALPVATLFARPAYSLKRLWTFVYRVIVLELFFGLLVVGLLLLLIGALRVFDASLPLFQQPSVRLSKFFLGSLLVASSYWISYQITYNEDDDSDDESEPLREKVNP